MKRLNPILLLAGMAAAVLAIVRRKRAQADVRAWQDATSDSSR